MATSQPDSVDGSFMPESSTLGRLRHRSIQVTLPVEMEPRGPVWAFPGYGSAKDVDVPPDELAEMREKVSTKKHQLGEWASTAISGNDILSSVLYSSGIVAAKAGKLSPIAMALVVGVLYFFRFIYVEVVSAIPLNGGSYNVLLNTTSKRVAAFGSALGIISYVATGVTSSVSSVIYLNSIVGGIPLVPSVIGLLFLFAVLNLFGITDSSRVAMALFFHHILVLSVLAVSSVIAFTQHTDILRENLRRPLPRVDFAGDIMDSNAFTAIFFGFGAAMLGITGFETSAQFVEEQKPGVFPKTLRNMWALAGFFNTLLTLMTIGVMPMDEKFYENKDFVVAELGEAAAGYWLKAWIAVDAFLVLNGGVLTSYVGITGLMRRLASDRVLPAFLLKQNKWRGTNHYIILLYFVIASSLVALLNGNTASIGGVYTYAFLGLMALFSFGCMLLKSKRAEIPREVHAPWWSCIVGFTFIIIGILANLLGDPKVLMYFSLYVIAVVVAMMIMLERVSILKVLLNVMRTVAPSPSSKEKRLDTTNLQHQSYAAVETPSLVALGRAREDPEAAAKRTGARGGRTITRAILDINNAPIFFFCKHPNMTIINKAILYVRKNEQTHNLRIVHASKLAVDDNGESGDDAVAVRKEFESIVTLFGHIYPKLKIDFINVHGAFEPALVQWLSETYRVPVNLMFIGQPGDKVVHAVAKLGVRVITA